VCHFFNGLIHLASSCQTDGKARLSFQLTPCAEQKRRQKSADPPAESCAQSKINFVANRTDRVGVECHRTRQGEGETMHSEQWKICLVSRTIGADRGRAARGRPSTI
jgi:hypothetical protein